MSLDTFNNREQLSSVRAKLNATIDEVNEISTSVGEPNGIASLDDTGKVPTDQLPASGTLTPATPETLGGVKPDGTIITVAEDGSITVPKSTAGSTGVVKPGIGLSVTSDGTLNNTSSNIPAGGTINQVLSKASNADFDFQFSTLEQPIASTSVLGSVKVDGTTVTADEDGTLHASGGGGSYTLPIATAETLGGVKQGSNVNIDSVTGAISVVATTGATGSQGPPGVAFVMPTNMPTAQYSTMAAGVAATTSGQYFGVPSANNNVIRVYENVSGAGVYIRTMPFTALDRFQARLDAIELKTLGRLPNYPVLDLDSIEIFQDGMFIRNLAISPLIPDERFVPNRPTVGTGGGASVTAGAPDPQGGTTGVSVTLAAQGGSGGQPNLSYIGGTPKMSTGQWTLSFAIRVPDGTADTPMRYNASWVGAGFGTAKTITTTWQTIQVTVNNTTETTDTANLFGSYPMALAEAEVTPTTAVTFYVANLSIVAGATPILQPSTIQSDIIGPVLYPKISDLADGLILNLAPAGLNSQMLFNFPSTLIKAFSFAICCKINDTTINEILLAYPSGNMYITVGIVSCDFMSGTMHSPSPIPANQWLTIIATSDATGGEIWINNIRVLSTTTPITQTTQSFFELFNQDLAFNFNGEVSTFALWFARLNAKEINQANNTMINRLVTKGIDYHDIKTYWILEGDSITQILPYAGAVAAEFTPALSYTNYAISGATLGNITDIGNGSVWSRWPIVSADISSQIAAERNIIYSVLIGANDISGILTSDDAIAWYNDLVSLWTAARALGAKVIAATLLDKTPLTDKTYLNQINALIRGDATKYDGLADYNANSSLTPATTTYYSDGEHPNAAGKVIMESILYPVMETVWQA